MPVAPLTAVDVFAGGGGFSLGAQRAGMDVVQQIELDRFCLDVLERNFPSVDRSVKDIRNANGTNTRRVDALFAGWPCVDLSQAGTYHKDGLYGGKSGLFFELVRLIKDIWPEWLIFENVPQAYNWRYTIERSLHEYQFEWGICAATAFGAYSRRRRAFIVGYPRGRSRRDILDFSHIPYPTFRTRGTLDVLPVCLPWSGGLSLERLGNCLIFDPEVDPTRIRKSDDVPRRMDRHRYKIIGNAVPPVVAEWIARRIVIWDEQNSQQGK